MATIKTYRCVQSTKLMDEMGIFYEDASLRLCDIKKDDYTFQCRTNVPSANDATVQEYAQSMKRGDVFPTMVVFRKKNGAYVTVCGRHRLLAMLRSYSATDTVSVLKVSDDTCPLSLSGFSVRENTKNGLRQTQSDVTRKAAEELLKTPLEPSCFEHSAKDIKAVADKYGVRSDLLRRAYYAKLTAKYFVSHGLKMPSSTRALSSLWRFRSGSDWAGLCRIVSECKDMPNLDQLIDGIYRDKVSAGCRTQALQQRINDAMAVAGAVAFKRQLRDPIDEITKCLALAEREVEFLPPYKDTPEERASELDCHLALVHRAIKSWKDRK